MGAICGWSIASAGPPPDRCQSGVAEGIFLLRAFPMITIVLCLFDVVAGYTISIIAAKRDLSMAPRDGD